MKYLLDTNAWVGWLRQNQPHLIRRIQQAAAGDLALCSVVIGELIYGAERSGPTHRAANLALVTQLRGKYTSVPFDDRAAEEYGPIRADLAARGQSIGPNDLMIAAIALANGCTLVTHNTAEFSRVPGLVIEDWQVP
jgi:tRNA(fMet)-specific endonuclease VapC